MPTNITYDNSSEANNELKLHPFEFITTVLTEYRSDEYIASTLTLLVQANVSTHQASIDCFIRGLANDSVDVTINSSGNDAEFLVCTILDF